MRVVSTGLAVALITLLGVAAPANAQKTDSFLRFESTVRAFSEKRMPRVGQRMAVDMLEGMQRFKGVSEDSAAALLRRQARHHIIVLSQCEFELGLSRQHASPAWQALADSIIRDSRRIAVRNGRLSTSEVNDVLGRAARMASVCLNDTR